MPRARPEVYSLSKEARTFIVAYDSFLRTAKHRALRSSKPQHEICFRLPPCRHGRAAHRFLATGAVASGEHPATPAISRSSSCSIAAVSAPTRSCTPPCHSAPSHGRTHSEDRLTGRQAKGAAALDERRLALQLWQHSPLSPPCRSLAPPLLLSPNHHGRTHPEDRLPGHQAKCAEAYAGAEATPPSAPHRCRDPSHAQQPDGRSSTPSSKGVCKGCKIILPKQLPVICC